MLNLTDFVGTYGSYLYINNNGTFSLDPINDLEEIEKLKSMFEKLYTETEREFLENSIHTNINIDNNESIQMVVDDAKAMGVVYTPEKEANKLEMVLDREDVTENILTQQDNNNLRPKKRLRQLDSPSDNPTYRQSNSSIYDYNYYPEIGLTNPTMTYDTRLKSFNDEKYNNLKYSFEVIDDSQNDDSQNDDSQNSPYGYTGYDSDVSLYTKRQKVGGKINKITKKRYKNINKKKLTKNYKKINKKKKTTRKNYKFTKRKNNK